MHDVGVLVRIVEVGQEKAHTVDPSAPLIIGFDQNPRILLRVGVLEHIFARCGVFVPFRSRGDIDRTELPLLQRVCLP